MMQKTIERGTALGPGMPSGLTQFSERVEAWVKGTDTRSFVVADFPRPPMIQYDVKISSQPSAAWSFGDVARAFERFYADRDDVEAVYLSGQYGQMIATVITNHEHYQREAMYALFECEYRLRQESEEVDLEINYLPRLGRNIDELVSVDAVQVFPRR
jgi:hypothetical protein